MSEKTRGRPPDELIRTSQLAELVGVSKETIRRYAAMKWFPDGVVEETPGGHRRFWRNKAAKLFPNNYSNRRPK